MYAVITLSNGSVDRAFFVEKIDEAIDKAFKHATILGFFPSDDMKDQMFMDREKEELRDDHQLSSWNHDDKVIVIKKLWRFAEHDLATL